MKKLMIILVITLGFVNNAHSQVKEYAAKEFSMKFKGEWFPWEKNNSKISLDLDKDMVIIHSYVPQIYTITGKTNSPVDEGGHQIAFTCINEHNEKCVIRFRLQNNGQKQIYIDHEDGTIYVYTLK